MAIHMEPQELQCERLNYLSLDLVENQENLLHFLLVVQLKFSFFSYSFFLFNTFGVEHWVVHPLELLQSHSVDPSIALKFIFCYP